MNKIKRILLTSSTMIVLLFMKIRNVFAAEPVDTDIWGEGQKFINSGNATLYGIPDPKEDFISIFGKVALFVLLPLCVVALITIGIVALVKVNKKKKQATNTNQNANNNGNINS